MTKTRLQQLKAELVQIDIEINKEKLKDYSLLTKEEIDSFSKKTCLWRYEWYKNTKTCNKHSR